MHSLLREVRGLGREYCEAMAEFGAGVACSDINPRFAQETVNLIKRCGRRADLALELAPLNICVTAIVLGQSS